MDRDVFCQTVHKFTKMANVFSDSASVWRSKGFPAFGFAEGKHSQGNVTS